MSCTMLHHWDLMNVIDENLNSRNKHCIGEYQDATQGIMQTLHPGKKKRLTARSKLEKKKINTHGRRSKWKVSFRFTSLKIDLAVVIVVTTMLCVLLMVVMCGQISNWYGHALLVHLHHLLQIVNYKSYLKKQTSMVIQND